MKTASEDDLLSKIGIVSSCEKNTRGKVFLPERS